MRADLSEDRALEILTEALGRPDPVFAVSPWHLGGPDPEPGNVFVEGDTIVFDDGGRLVPADSTPDDDCKLEQPADREAAAGKLRHFCPETLHLKQLSSVRIQTVGEYDLVWLYEGATTYVVLQFPTPAPDSIDGVAAAVSKLSPEARLLSGGGF
jgi:hypothetical protein